MAQITQDFFQAIEALEGGKPVAIPTETVYGMAALVTDEAAIRAVFALKNRPLNHPLIVHVADNCDLTTLVKHIPDYAQQLIQHFWPGPLTLVFPCKDTINPLITGGQSTVAIRCPAHPLTQKLLRHLKAPLVAPSANPFGRVSPTTALHVYQAFSQEDLTILDGGRCQVGIESTILDVTQPESYTILRHGVIDELAIAKVISTPCVHKDSDVRVPGKLESHYQPQKPLYYFASFADLTTFCQKHSGEVYVLAKQNPTKIAPELFHPLEACPQKMAYDLFFQLRQADDSKAKYIAIELPPKTQQWLGLRERILKAGSAWEG